MNVLERVELRKAKLGCAAVAAARERDSVAYMHVRVRREEETHASGGREHARHNSARLHLEAERSSEERASRNAASYPRASSSLNSFSGWF
jgi:hypothetical protein